MNLTITNPEVLKGNGSDRKTMDIIRDGLTEDEKNHLDRIQLEEETHLELNNNMIIGYWINDKYISLRKPCF